MADLLNSDNTTSCFLTDSFEGLNQQFTDVQEISTQGFTALYRAKRYGRWYALKTLNEDTAQQMAYAQVLRKELEVLMQMQHPNVVQAVGLEEVEGIGPCIVMEYVDGVTLETLMENDGQTTQAERRRMVCELCEAVAYIHSLGIVHRDLKPENIMVTRNGHRIKLQNQLHRVDDAKKTALHELRKQMKASALDRHVDTLSRWDYRWMDLSRRISQVNRFVYDYTDNLAASFTTQERDQIRESMLNEWQSWSSRIINRAYSIRSKTDKEMPDSFVGHKDKIPKEKL